jgi:transposase
MCATFKPPDTLVLSVPFPQPLTTAADELALLPGPPRITSAHEVSLRSFCRRTTAAAGVVRRAHMVLGVIFEGRSISSVAAEHRVTRDTVRVWVKRFRAAPGMQVLEDQKRSGRPCRITFADEGLVLSLACQRPEDFGRCEGRMTQDIIMEQARLQGCNVSRSSVQRILAAAEVRPHQEIYYLFTRKDDPHYIPRRDAICDIYVRQLPSDEIVVCFDEKTGVQARGFPKRVPGGGWTGADYGRPARMEQHYQRHGSRTLAVAARPDTGKLVAAEVYASGTYKTQETIEFLRLIRRQIPEARLIHLVMDNGPTHRSAGMRAFLSSDEGKAFNVLYTPNHASWLNLAENVLSRFSRRYLHRKRWTGLDHFDEDMRVCFKAYQTVAKPITWRYNPKERAETRVRGRPGRDGQPRRSIRRGTAACTPGN